MIMDVEQIQKVNKLAVELLNQGIAASRDDAVAQAEKLLSRNGSGALQNIHQQQPEAAPEPAAAAPQPIAPQAASVQAQTDSAIKQDVEAIKQALGKNNEFVIKMLKDMGAKIESLSSELAVLKSKINMRASQPVQPQRRAAPAPSAPAQSAQPNQSSEKHPRQGEFQPGDKTVSVEEVFYMGNK